MPPSTHHAKHTDVLFAWELGAGIGHATRMRPLAEQAMAAGLGVKCLAIRRADAAALMPCPVDEAPWLRAPRHKSPPHIGHLADTLAALGWSDPDHLQEAVRRWRDTLERERPAVLVMDSAPVALLASQSLPIRRVWLADGWNTPPNHSPLPDLTEPVMGLARPVADTEPDVVASINTVLDAYEQPPIDRLYDLFARVQCSAMLTLEELDPHGPRPNTHYRGVWGVQPEAMPVFPASTLGADVPGVFAYLKPFPQRAATLRLLASSGLPTLVFAQGATEVERASIRGGAVRLLDRPVDWCRAADQLAFVVCHASPAMTGLALQYGVPVVGIPLSLEQTAIAKRAAQSGAVIEAHHADAESIRSAMHRVLTDEAVIESAQRFAKQYANLQPDQEANRLGDEIIELCHDPCNKR